MPGTSYQFLVLDKSCLEFYRVVHWCSLCDVRCRSGAVWTFWCVARTIPYSRDGTRREAGCPALTRFVLCYVLCCFGILHQRVYAVHQDIVPSVNGTIRGACETNL